MTDAANNNIDALIKRLRSLADCDDARTGEPLGSGIRAAWCMRSAADALEALQAENEALRSNTNIIVERQKCRNAALEEAAQVAEDSDAYDTTWRMKLAAAIRALAGDKP